MLRSSEGLPIGDAEVRPFGIERLATRTDESGYFRLPHVAAGDLDIYVHATDGRVEMFRVRVGPEEPLRHDLTLPRPGVIRGTVNTGTGEGATELLYLFVPERLGDATRQFRLCSDLRGEFGIRVLPGRYVIQVLRRDRIVATESLVVTEGAVHHIALTVPDR